MPPSVRFSGGLSEIAANLGSDVPFFLTGGTAAARGRGEVVTALADGPPLWFVIVKPDENVSTGAAYQALDAIPDRASARATRKMEEVLQLLARGLRNKEIAARLHVSERTVNFHLANIYQKLNVSGRTEALSKALEQGLITA